MADRDLARGEVREGVVRDVVRRDGREDVARPRAPHPDAGPGRRDVADLDRAVVGQVLPDPAEIVVADGRPRHDQEPVRGQPGDREVGLDAATVVQHLGVDDPPDRRRRRRSRTGRWRNAQAPGPLDLDLGERALVEQPGGPARRERLGPDRRRPVLAGPAARSERLERRVLVRREPVRALPAGLLAEHARRAPPAARTPATGAAAGPPGAPRSGSGCRSRSRRPPSSGRACTPGSGTGRRTGGCPSSRGRAPARRRRSSGPSAGRSRRRRRSRGRRTRPRRRTRGPRTRRG